MDELTIRKRIRAVVETLVDRGVASRDRISGCDPDEIAELESRLGHQLPFAYREFLQQMGRGAGRFYEGTDMFYPRILDLTQAGRELLSAEKPAMALPNDGLVFSMHQGYQFLFIRVDEGMDPPVYFYLEQSGQFEKKADTFSEFLLNTAQDEW